MKETIKITIIHNIISPYKTLLFNELASICQNLTILYMAETENNRDWAVRKDLLKFPYNILFKGSLDSVNQLRVAVRTWKWLDILRPDVLIIGGYDHIACWATLLWARMHKKKIIFWSSSNEDDHKRVFYKESVKKHFIKKCNAYNVYGTKSRDYLLRLGAKKDRIFILGNNTDNSFYYNETMTWREKRNILSQGYGIPPNNFLYIGRFSPEKNIFHLLDAYKRIRNNNNWGLILVGNGLQKTDIEDYINKNHIRNVFMPGFKQKDDIPRFFAVSDVLILPSISETWGLVVNEAMAAGLPVLVSKKCGCYPDIVKDNVNGFGFDPYDGTELYDLMKEIVDSRYDLRHMGEMSLELIREYTPRTAANVVAETIEYVLQK